MALSDSNAARIAARTGVRLRLEVPGREVTTVAAGGTLRALFEPENLVQLQALLHALSDEGQPYRILGAGSNLLIADEGIADCVVRLGAGFREVRFVDDTTIDIGGANGLMRISRNLSAAGLSGIEFASGIPASVGGAVRMNAGAHGGQIADIVSAVDCVDPAGERFTLDGAELKFGYRRSTLPEGAIVISARIKLVRGEPGEIERRRSELLAYRKSTQPLTVPSFGSVFKNPSPARSAGAIIEELGLKGRRHGGAEISSLHANWIVNPERSATVTEIRALIAECQHHASLGGAGDLEPEVVIWEGGR
ncbi:MAG: hypothetical protein RL417_2216 [Pseudomonadota bacterium]|jgi:UDP-N-acetylmuramate dehydrogenase